MQKYVFVLRPPYSRSIMLWRLPLFKHDLFHSGKPHNFRCYKGIAKTVTKKMAGRVRKLIGEWARSGQ